MLESLRGVVSLATQALEEFEYTDALEATERFFWGFCDDYLELVKERAYATGPTAESAKAALVLALGVQLRLFAPYLPFVTEEVWSWSHAGSVHLAPRISTSAAAMSSISSTSPVVGRSATVGHGARCTEPAWLHDQTSSVTNGRYGAKSQAKVSMKTEASSAEFSGPAAP